MDENDRDKQPKQIPIRDLKTDPTAEDLLSSPSMQPYLKLATAVMGHKPVRPALEEITALPLEERYTWRVASALKWAFADFENLNVVADRRTLRREDLDKLVELLRLRPLQFCLFLAALYGEERMEKIISSSVEQVKTIQAKRRETPGRQADARADSGDYGTDEDAEREVILQLLEKWRLATAAKDIETILDLVAEDVVFLPSSLPPIRGKEAVEAMYRAFFPRYREISQEAAIEELHTAGDLAFLWGTDELRLVPEDGSAQTHMKGKGLSILKREADGSWKFWRGINNMTPQASS